jgi:hypothetical protein
MSRPLKPKESLKIKRKCQLVLLVRIGLRQCEAFRSDDNWIVSRIYQNKEAEQYCVELNFVINIA